MTCLRGAGALPFPARQIGQAAAGPTTDNGFGGVILSQETRVGTVRDFDRELEGVMRPVAAALEQATKTLPADHPDSAWLRRCWQDARTCAGLSPAATLRVGGGLARRPRA